jgi:putative component of toxin-antitoxin plasmid stabilization module
MIFDEYFASIKNETPSSELSETLTSLWWDKKGDWERAHTIAQEIPTTQGSAVHAYLHRKEGILWNADYWYSRAGRIRPDIPLEAEWKLLVDEMLLS